MGATLHSFIDVFDAYFNEADTPIQLKEIRIPKIQRDYAQGRENNDVDRVRRRFLDSLYRAVTETPITLDFIYGDIKDDGVMTPLDGQQRLTTLFLLHWYAAKKCAVDADDYSFLNRFSYETRPSSQYFCEHLVEFNPSFRGVLSNEIKDQPWFPLSWMHDPTIHSMLVMLDSIDEVFGNVSDLWERLNNNTITFHFRPIKDMGLTDELYIKMNSRGKPLTVFEHFKAELERQIRALDENTSKRIMAKVDREWMDLLWQYRDAETGTDADMITDDEFLNYFKFISDVICYRNGESAQGRSYDEFYLIDKYFSHQNEAAYDNYLVLESFFDCWCNLKELGFIDPTDFLNSVFSDEHVEGKVEVDSTDIFKDCVHTYADREGRSRRFPLGKVLLLYSVCLYLQNRTDISREQFIRRIRIINNLIKNSNDEISDRSDRNRMLPLIQQSQSIMLTGLFDDGIDNNYNVHQIEEEKEKKSFVEANPDKAELLYALEDHELLRGQMSIVGLDYLDYSDRFVSLFKCDLDKIDCALMAIGDYTQREVRTNWRYQFASYVRKEAWLSLLHKSANNRGFENTHEILIDLLSRNETFDDDYLQRIANDYILECESNRRFPWRYYYIKYPEFRPGRFGKAFWEDKANKPYEMLVLLTQYNSSESSYVPYLFIADPEHINRDERGRQLLYSSSYITSKNDSYEVVDKVSGELNEKITIEQDDAGVDIEDRVQKLISYLRAR